MIKNKITKDYNLFSNCTWELPGTTWSADRLNNILLKYKIDGKSFASEKCFEIVVLFRTKIPYMNDEDKTQRSQGNLDTN